MIPALLEEKILSFPDLAVEDQEALLDEVSEDAEASSLLASVREFDRQLALARPTMEEQMLALIMDPLSQAPADVALQKKINLDPVLKADFEKLAEDYQALTKARDVKSHFESLVGYSLDAIREDLDQSQAESQSTVKERARDRPALRLVRSIKSVRRLSLAATILIGCYFILFLASSITQSPINKMGSVDAFQDELVAPVFRGGNESTDSAESKYYLALSHLEEGSISTIGLFPGYDKDKLNAAVVLLKEVIQDESGSNRLTPLSLNAHFYLGKAWLGLNEPAQARIVLGTVAVAGGVKSTEAIALVAQLEILGF